MIRVYVNVYAVTRHYGGPQEGGWWYNVGQPLASVPVPAKKVRGHAPGSCKACDDIRKAFINVPDKAFCLECHCEKESEHEIINGECRFAVHEAHHVVPSAGILEQTVESMTKMFEGDKEGNIYSVLGGTDIVVNVEGEMAAVWPERKPHYE
jgi:hypothetical protein